MTEEIGPLWKEHWPELCAKLERRMEEGYQEYGDGSFSLSLSGLLGEIEEEIMDQFNWSFIAWVRLRKLMARVKSIEQLKTLGFSEKS